MGCYLKKNSGVIVYKQKNLLKFAQNEEGPQFEMVCLECIDICISFNFSVFIQNLIKV